MKECYVPNCKAHQDIKLGSTIIYELPPKYLIGSGNVIDSTCEVITDEQANRTDNLLEHKS